MAEELSGQQKQAVENRGGKLLVSAAAGSGKTRVLVERLLLYITQGEGKINIDDFLMITYTKAAAAELRGKIAAKLNERLAEDPGNKHLQRQLQRLYLAKISTVHAFCSDILREHAYQLDIPGDFRVAEESECALLQLEVVEKLLERSYENNDPGFYALIDSQEYGRNDRTIPEIVLKVYNSARCHVDPDQWLDACISSNTSDGVEDVSQTVWGQFLISKLHGYLDMQLDALNKCIEKADQNGSMAKQADLLRNTVGQLSALKAMTRWDDIVRNKDIDYGRLVFGKNCTDLVLADRIKAVRNGCKSGMEKKLLPFADESSQVLKDLDSCAEAVKGLVSFVREFSKEYERVKKSKRIMDFSDLEHKTLDLLVGKNRDCYTAVANEIGERFVEIMVDEYQDSNAVQDKIFEALTEKRQNCFMVGDVKQSIYQFRLADPGIFLKKYRQYVLAEDAVVGQGRKLLLSKNYRSAKSVIQAVNDVFTHCMDEDVGGLAYGEDERLYEGIEHAQITEPEIELRLIDVVEDTYEEEAAYTAERICQLVDGTHEIRTKDGTRPITPEDIVILLRSPGSVGNEFRYALESRGIRVNFGKGINLLNTEEVSFLRGMLQIIDNPLQDIPLLAVLTSRFIGFTADDLAVIRAGARKSTVYEALKKSEYKKAVDFVALFTSLRDESKLLNLSAMISKIIRLTRMESVLAAMDDGAVRRGNLQDFCDLANASESRGQKGLGQFLEFLTSSEKNGLQTSSETTIPGAVTIMSIHKSKGLEFPVVFLCGLSRDFNKEDSRAQILCHKELGIGLNCVDTDKRIRYPSIAKKAIAAKMIEDGISEEMRVLYVAMTRAKDRLIMTYAESNLQKNLTDMVNRIDICQKKLLTSGAHCPGTWILLTALNKIESGALFALAGYPDKSEVSEVPWRVSVETVSAPDVIAQTTDMTEEKTEIDLSRLKTSLFYSYPHKYATTFPSKLTATQMKGRTKDLEAAENTVQEGKYFRSWTVPSFAGGHEKAVDFGNTVHKIMQYLDLHICNDYADLQWEVERLVREGIVEEKAIENLDLSMIWNLFDSDIGTRIRSAKNLIREFKFSVLVDASEFDDNLKADQILLQGVVDCAMIDDDGIVVLDYKTDRVTDENLDELVRKYTDQVKIYAKVLSQIFKKEVKSAHLYFFRKNLLIPVV